MQLLGQGVYTLSQAAKLVGLKPRRVKEWFLGERPVLAESHEPVGSAHAISFLDLVEVYVAGHLRDHGVTLPTLRKVHTRLQRDWKATHPFARKELLSDGADVFVRGMDAAGREEVYDAFTKQKAFPEMILPFLKQIDYAPLLASRWNIAAGVVVDPQLSLGKPVVLDTGIPTYLIADAYRVNGTDAELVADLYALTPAEVMNAVRFEARLAA